MDFDYSWRRDTWWKERHVISLKKRGNESITSRKQLGEGTRYQGINIAKKKTEPEDAAENEEKMENSERRRAEVSQVWGEGMTERRTREEEKMQLERNRFVTKEASKG